MGIPDSWMPHSHKANYWMVLRVTAPLEGPHALPVPTAHPTSTQHGISLALGTFEFATPELGQYPLWLL